eukprot:139698_1
MSLINEDYTKQLNFYQKMMDTYHHDIIQQRCYAFFLKYFTLNQYEYTKAFEYFTQIRHINNACKKYELQTIIGTLTQYFVETEPNNVQKIEMLLKLLSRDTIYKHKLYKWQKQRTEMHLINGYVRNVSSLSCDIHVNHIIFAYFYNTQIWEQHHNFSKDIFIIRDPPKITTSGIINQHFEFIRPEARTIYINKYVKKRVDPRAYERYQYILTTIDRLISLSKNHII